MIKFNVIILLACIGSTGVLAGSILNSLDSDEIANLKGKNIVFADFCLSTRDYVRSEALKKTGSAVSGTFQSGLKLYWDASLVQMKAVEKLTAQLRNPKAPIEGLDESDPVDAVIISGMKKIQGSDNYLKSLVHVLTHAVSAYQSHIKGSLKSEVGKIDSGAKVAFDSFQEMCSNMFEFEDEIRKRFAKTKEEVVAKDASLAEVELENVECVTTKRVLNMATVCRFVESAKEPIKDLLGIGEL